MTETIQIIEDNNQTIQIIEDNNTVRDIIFMLSVSVALLSIALVITLSFLVMTTQ
jgi:hypothetical protein